MSPHKLTKLVIDEVSSVPAGAARGARVLITKRLDQEKEKPMSAVDVLKQDGRVAFDVARNIKKLMDAGLPYDQAATQVFRFEKQGGYREVEPELAPTGYYAESASDKDAPVRDSKAWEGEIPRLMAERSLTRQQAIDVLGTRSHRAEKIAKGQNW